MPRSNPIEWTPEKRQSLSKMVKRFNDKVRREAKKNPAAAPFLPKTKSVRTLRKELKTEAELRQLQRDINVLFRPGALKLISPYSGVVTTRYESQITKNAARRIAAARKKELERLRESPNFYGLTKEQERHYQRPTFHGDTQSAWNAFVQSLQRKGKQDYLPGIKSIYHNNFGKAAVTALGKERGEELAELANSLPPDYLYDIYYDNPNLTLDFVYGRDSVEIRYATIRAELQRAIERINDNEMDV